MATLAGNTIASTYPLLLKVDSNGLDGTLRAIQDGDATDSVLYLATDSALISGNGTKLYFFDADGGEYISADNGGDLTIAAGTALNITADVIDLSDATKDVTLNAAVDALNFDSNTLSIDASNNRVGIGTASPSEILHLSTTGATTTLQISSGTGSSTTGISQIYFASKDEHGGNTHQSYIKSTIDGGSSTSATKMSFHNRDSGGTVQEYLTIKADGSIVPASAGTLNTHYGDGAGDAIQSGGNYNTLIGHDAGGAITTGDANVLMGDSAGDAITIGVNNCAIGNDALTAEDVGNNSTALGNAALASQNSDSNNELTENTGVGYAAGYYNVTGTGNTSVGYYSMVGASGNSHSDNTALGAYSGTAITGADSNVLVGYRAGDALTTGSNNVAMGKHALGNNTDVDKCVAIGNAAMSQSNITSAADGSVAVGYFALGNLTTGENNIAIGNAALIGHTTGHRNIAIGRDAMGDTDSGSNALDSDDNIFIGLQAGGGAWANAKSEYNVVVGNYALDAQLNGASSNICVGYGTGTAVIGGSGNIIAGHNAGNTVSSGSNNVLIGYQAGTDSVALSTGDNNICIGRNAHTSANSAANQYAIGQDVECTGNNTITIGVSSNTASLALDGSTTAWAAASSDERYKENIKTSTAGLSFLNDLRPVTYNWKKQKDVPSDMPSYEEGSDKPVLGHEYGTTLHGFIAQEVKSAIDSHNEIKEGFKMWKLRDDGVQTVADGNLVPILVKAVQELNAKVEELETKLNNKES